MKAKIDLVSIIAEDVPKMVAFYRDVLGFPIKTVVGDYHEFQMEGVRFSICDRQTMIDATGSDIYLKPRSGLPFELAFPVDRASEVDEAYAEIVAKGGAPVRAPEDMPWGQRAAFFADPEGNIHEIFTNL